MSTTSSFRAEAWKVALLVTSLAMAGCSGICCPAFAPDAPEPAREQPERPAELALAPLDRPVALRSVVVTEPSPELVAALGRAAWTEGQPLRLIEVEAAIPFDPVPRTSFPVIVLNGRSLAGTRQHPEDGDRLVAPLPEEGIEARNRVEVMWIGAEEETRTREPLYFTAEDATSGRRRTHEEVPD